MTERRFLLVGGAGFIGSHFADRLLSTESTERVTVYDNFSSGREWHLAHHERDPRLRIVRADVKETRSLEEAMNGHDLVIHLASNPDIARAVTEPAIDFDEGTVLTHRVLEAMRVTSTPRIMYASGSGVYGELGEVEATEDYGPMLPTSTYGASKLAGEAMIAAYTFMFGLTGCAFRFGNVVGPRQTHGVGFDFVRRLSEDPTSLRILGDGSQSKSYVHIYDVVEAVMTANADRSIPFSAYNVATGDYVTVREIAEIAVDCLDLARGSVRFEFTGGDRGWKGDVPIVRLNTTKIQSLGWRCQAATREALRSSIAAMLNDQRAGRL